MGLELRANRFRPPRKQGVCVGRLGSKLAHLAQLGPRQVGGYGHSLNCSFRDLPCQVSFSIEGTGPCMVPLFRFHAYLREGRVLVTRLAHQPSATWLYT